MINISNKICIENENTRFMSNNVFSSENLALYEIIPKNMVEPEKLQMTIWRRVAC
jgi:hypothetical protein